MRTIASCIINRYLRALPPLETLITFEAVGRHSSFTGASRELFLTQSAVSKQMRQLEVCIGVPLFERKPRGVMLTPAAQGMHDGRVEAFGQGEDFAVGTGKRGDQHAGNTSDIDHQPLVAAQCREQRAGNADDGKYIGFKLLAWLGGVVTYHLLANLLPDVGATLPALLLAGGLQWLLGRWSKTA